VSESEEQVARELAEELRKLKVEDVLISVLIQISAIGYRRLGLTEETKDDRDLPQAKLAIDTMKALMSVLGEVVPADLIRDFEQSVANLQLAYATAASSDM
jgi:amino acid transporter